MKIVQINAVYNFSSTGRTTEELHNYCKAQGIDSYVFCMNWSDEDNGIFKIGNALDYKMHALLSRISGKQAWFSRNSTKKLIKQLDQIKPDSVFLRNLHGNFINLPILLNYLATKDIATIAVMHDCWFFTGHCTHYTAHKCFKWHTQCHTCPLMKADNPSFFFDTSKEMYEAKKKLFHSIPRLSVLGVSKWITSEAEKSRVLESAKIFRTVYNWIDVTKFYPRDTDSLRQKLSLGNSPIVLGVAQGWSYRKGLSHFINLAKARPDIKVILVGKIAEAIDAPKNLIPVGPTKSIEELAEYYSLADVLLVCSLQETFGKVSAEALACGTPIIANNTTANPEIAGNDCGLTVEDNNDDEILNAVDEILQRGKDYYRPRCVSRAKNEFEKNIQSQKYIQVAIDTIGIRQ